MRMPSAIGIESSSTRTKWHNIRGTFPVILGKVRPYFRQAREVIDCLNEVIKASIIGAALIRVLDANEPEHARFSAANRRGRDIGLSIVRLFSFMIPIITFVTSMGTLGSFVAFMSYLVLLIFPILVIGFMSNLIAQASASHARISGLLRPPPDGLQQNTQAGWDRISAILHMQNDMPLLPAADLPDGAMTDTLLEFRNVSFRYTQEHLILQKVKRVLHRAQPPDG